MTNEELDAIEAKYRCDAGQGCRLRAEHERNDETLRMVAEVRRLRDESKDARIRLAQLWGFAERAIYTIVKPKGPR